MLLFGCVFGEMFVEHASGDIKQARNVSRFSYFVWQHKVFRKFELHELTKPVDRRATIAEQNPWLLFRTVVFRKFGVLEAFGPDLPNLMVVCGKIDLHALLS